VLDYATVLATAAAPTLFRFPKDAARLAYGLAGGYLTLSLLTDYPLAAKRAIPFRGHGAAEGLVGAVLPAMPRAMHFGGHRAARNFFLGLTALTAVVAALTDWDAKAESWTAMRGGW
jgi:hypothetical protein